MDTMLMTLNKHDVMFDTREFVLKHPEGCKNRGSGLDRGKTFHSLKNVLLTLSDCGEAVSAENEAVLSTNWKRIRETAKY